MNANTNHRPVTTPSPGNETATPPDRAAFSANGDVTEPEDFTLTTDEEAHPQRKSRRGLWALLACVLIGAVVFYYWRYGKTSTPAMAYKTATITRGDITQSVTANGQITPLKTVTVGSQVSGIITELMVDYNSQVTNGQVIAQIDPSTYQQLLVQAEADQANATAAQYLAQLNYNRAKELLAGEALPQADLDTAEGALKQANATVRSREAALRKAQVDLQRTTIYSPIDGIVITRAVDVGQTVAASLNAPTLFTIAQDLRQMHIEAAVSEADVGGVKEGQHVQFTVDAYPNSTFHGQISQVRYEASTNQNVVNYTTIVDVKNEDLRLRPGMTANATIITAQRKDVLRLPNAALRFKPAEDTTPIVSQANSGPASREGSEARPARTGGTPNQTKTVYLMGAEPEASPSLRPVQVALGVSDNLWTEVTSGVNENDAVVTGSSQAGATAQTATSNPFSGGMRPPR